MNTRCIRLIGLFTISTVLLGDPINPFLPQALAGWPVESPFGGTDPTGVTSDLDIFSDSNLSAKLRGLDSSRQLHKDTEISGKHFGKGFGAGLRPELDPVVDKLGDTLTASGKATAEAFGKELDDAAATFKLDFNANLTTFRTDLNTDLRNVVNKDIHAQIDHFYAELHKVMDRHADIMGTSVTRLEQLTDKTTSRVEALQRESYERYDGIVQDTLPATASVIAQEMEILGIFATFFVVLVGAIGYRMLKAASSDFSDADERHRARRNRTWYHSLGSYLLVELTAIWKAVAHNISLIPRVLLRVGVPMLVLAVIVHAGYWAYCKHQSNARHARLVKTAEVYESNGDFRTALAYRRRLLALAVDPESRYFAWRTGWLSDYLGQDLPRDRGTLLRQLVSVCSHNDFKKFIDADREIEAVQLYILSGQFAENSVLTSLLLSASAENGIVDGRAAIRERINEYCKQLEQPDRPYLGRLVLMAQLRQQLNDVTRSVRQRMEEADFLADKIVHLYPGYAPGLLLSSYIASLRIDAAEKAVIKYDSGLFDLPSGKAKDSLVRTVLGIARGKMQAASSLDKSLARLFVLDALEGHEEIAKHVYGESHKFRAWKVQEQNLADGKDLAANLLDVVAPAKEKSDSEKQADEEITKKLDNELREWLDGLIQGARSVFQIAVVADLEAQKAARRSIRRAIGHMHLTNLIKWTREHIGANVKPADEYKMCGYIVKEALDVERPDIAELWYERAQEIKLSNQKVVFDDLGVKEQDIRQNLVPDLVYLP